jgi:anti-sigma regulatory factor (Ser/Thr protein kinase)
MEWTFDSADATAATAVRVSFRALLREVATDDSDIFAADVVYGELVGNAVRHAGGRVDISLVWLEQGAALRVRDYGEGFLLANLKQAHPEAEGGRGLHLASHFADMVHVARVPAGGAELTVVLPVWRRETVTAGCS